MVSWKAWVLNAILRFAMKRHGDKRINIKRSRRMTANPPRRALRVPQEMRVEEIETGEGLRFDKADPAEQRATDPPVIVYYPHGRLFLRIAKDPSPDCHSAGQAVRRPGLWAVLPARAGAPVSVWQVGSMRNRQRG
jgi:hypothetical protein